MDSHPSKRSKNTTKIRKKLLAICSRRSAFVCSLLWVQSEWTEPGLYQGVVFLWLVLLLLGPYTSPEWASLCDEHIVKSGARPNLPDLVFSAISTGTPSFITRTNMFSLIELIKFNGLQRQAIRTERLED